MAKTIQELEAIAGIKPLEERKSFDELMKVKQKVNKLAKKNDMKAVSKILKDLAKEDSKDFDEVLEFLVKLT